jgi:hypothetical protein
VTVTTSPTTERRALTIRHFCDSYSIGRTLCNELMKAGVLETRHIGRRVLITADSAERWWQSLPSNTQRVA